MLPRATPAEVGIDPKAVQAWIDVIESQPNETRSVMVVRHGKVVVEGWWSPFKADEPHLLYSLSKSFTSTAAGLAIKEGFFKLDDTFAFHFPESVPANADPRLLRMKVRDALTMSTGHGTEPPCKLSGEPGEDWVSNFLRHPLEKEPGSKFMYNSPATYMVSALIQKTTGQTVTQFLTPRLYEPLGIDQHPWQQCPKGIDVGGWGLSLTTESIAKFGLLYLQDGVREGNRLLPEGWVEQATSEQIENGDGPDNDWNQGYGFQFWMCKRLGAYRADGAFGQLCVVIPALNMVVVMTNCTDDIGRTLDTIWDVLVPGVSRAALPTTTSNDGLDLRLRDLMTGPVSAKSAPITGRFGFSEGVLVIDPQSIELQLGSIKLQASTTEWLDQEIDWDGWKFDGSARASWTDSMLLVKVVDRKSPLYYLMSFEASAQGVSGTIETRGVFTPGEPKKFEFLPQTETTRS